MVFIKNYQHKKEINKNEDVGNSNNNSKFKKLF